MDIGAVAHLTAQCSETFWKHLKKYIYLLFSIAYFYCQYNIFSAAVIWRFFWHLCILEIICFKFLENVSLCCAVECATASISIYDFSIIISFVGSVRSVLCSGIKRRRVQHFQCSSHLTFFLTLLLTTCLSPIDHVI